MNLVVVLAAGIIALAVLLAPPVPAQFDFVHQTETEHLLIAWKEGAIDEEGVAYAKEQGEKFYGEIEALIGDPAVERITIMLHGPAERPDGSWEYPRVDRLGRVQLFQFGPTYHSFFGALPHEMVHSFRINRRGNRDWFFEEGFAEFVALRVGKSMQGFPWYDTPVVVATGQWLKRGEDIPLQQLRDKHSELNLPCKAQSYTLRSSFLDYLGKTYGDEPVLRMAKENPAGSDADYSRFLGKPFETLAAEWRVWLLAAYGEVEDVEAQARRYRQETPIQYMQVCPTPGE